MSRASRNFLDACEQNCRPVVRAFKESRTLPIEGAFLELSEELLKLSPNFVRDFFGGIALRPPLAHVEKQLREQVRQVLWHWANELSPITLGYSVYNRTGSSFRLMERRWGEIERTVCETLRAIYGGVEDSERQVSTGEGKGRHAEVEGFISKMLDAGHRIIRKDIMIVAGHEKDPPTLQRFQYNIARASKSAIRDYERALKKTPDEFMQSLKNLKSKKSRKPKTAE